MTVDVVAVVVVATVVVDVVVVMMMMMIADDKGLRWGWRFNYIAIRVSSLFPINNGSEL